MKSFLKKIGLAFLIMIAAVACNESLEDTSEENVIIPEKPTTLGTFDHYWFQREQIQIKRSENKSFVLFRSSDRLALLSSLRKIGIGIDSSKIKAYGYGGTDLSGDAAYSFLNYEWAEIGINYMSATAIPEVAYSAPYYSWKGGPEFPLTNLVCVYLSTTADTTHLKRLSKEYNVGIIGKVPKIPQCYVVACTKQSKGNALEVANLFYGSGLFESAEPVFISQTPN